MKLLETRLFVENKSYIHYCNEYQKFNGTPAVRYNDENEFFRVIEQKVVDGESFSFGSDSKAIIEKWFTRLYACATPETHSKMLLYTSEVDTKIQENWNNKIVFYSPKITTGNDITCINSSEQFMYITGQSVSSINLLQMSTRTRNMTQLSYFSSARSVASQYDSIDDCINKVSADFVSNQLGFSFEDIELFLLNNKKFMAVEDIHLNMYVRNCYVLDLHGTNVVYFFEQELKNCGFNILNSVGKYVKMEKAVINEFNVQTQEIKDNKYEQLLESFNEPESIFHESIIPMKKRC